MTILEVLLLKLALMIQVRHLAIVVISNKVVNVLRALSAQCIAIHEYVLLFDKPSIFMQTLLLIHQINWSGFELL